ncbi:hypothetical protein [Poseidonocella sp. HB161398]|uniref:hypothetical protein n=1 Tax=Poseidonocella sp. HB161398 TaxID=2320855 RepID=UPI001109158C|nr:hypothetical protein [Poseidonocella sp. HB161398]
MGVFDKRPKSIKIKDEWRQHWPTRPIAFWMEVGKRMKGKRKERLISVLREVEAMSSWDKVKE